MGKFANLEIIPLDDNSPPVNSRGQNIPPGGMSAPFISDKTIIPRVQKYLENNENQTYVDITTMADDLQKLYKDYGRRKRGPFRSSVKKAYNAILQNFGHGQDNLSTSEEFSDESAPGSNFENSMNNQFMDMYKRNSQAIQETEPPIDISSDDSNDTPTFPLPQEKTSNGASTSHKLETVVITPRVLNAPVIKPSTDFPPQDSLEPLNRRGKKRKINQTPTIPPNGSKKHKTGIGAVTKSTVTFQDIGGLNNILLEISYVILMEKDKHVEDINGDSPAVMLLHGPTGCGKTLLARAIAGEWKIPLLEIQANDLIGGISGESEERIKSTFNEAAALAPCVLFIDGIDTVFQNRKFAQKKMESRIVTQLLNSIDALIQKGQEENVILIGAANSIDLIDPAILTRFYNKFSLGLPNEEARIAILKVLTKNYTSLSPDFDYQKIACCTPGFSGADLLCLFKKGIMLVNKRVYNYLLKEEYSSTNTPKPLVPKLPVEENTTSLETKSDQHNNVDHENNAEVDVVEPQNTNSEVVVIDDDNNKADELSNAANADIYLQNLHKNPDVLLQELLKVHFSGKKYALDNSICVLTTEDIINSVKNVTPACKSEGFATVPDVTWDDIGSLANIREELQFSILGPLKYPTYSQGEESSGVLLCGPPGCGKTLLAKAIANEARINFLSVNGPELLSMYVGESERAVRNCFEKAQNSSPCIIFFDEIDALCPHRSQNEQDKVTDRVVNQLLTEMDGVKGKREGVFLLAATNRLDRLDRALLRPGRFSEIIYVPIPTPNDRVNILRTITKVPLAPDVDLDVIARLDKCDGFTGADLKQLIKMAKRFALKASVLEGTSQESITLTMEHFTKALLRVKPSVSKEDQEKYEKFRKVYTLPNIDGDEEMELS